MPPSDSPDASASAAATSAPSSDDKVRIYNRSRRQFTHSVYPKILNQATGERTQQVDYVSAPNSFVTVPRWIAEKWLKDFPDDFVSNDDALKAVDATAAELALAKEANVALEAEKQSLADELAAAKAQLAKLQAS